MSFVRRLFLTFISVIITYVLFICVCFMRFRADDVVSNKLLNILFYTFKRYVIVNSVFKKQKKRF